MPNCKKLVEDDKYKRCEHCRERNLKNTRLYRAKNPIVAYEKMRVISKRLYDAKKAKSDD
jgi:hypothetical protein